MSRLLSFIGGCFAGAGLVLIAAGHSSEKAERDRKELLRRRQFIDALSR